MEQFTDVAESILSKSNKKAAVKSIKNMDMMSKLTTWMSVLWKNTYATADWTDAVGREVHYGDVVAMIDWENWDCSFGIVVEEPNDDGVCRVFQMGAEDWEQEDPFFDCICATPTASKLLVLARMEDGEKMIRLLLNVKKK